MNKKRENKKTWNVPYVMFFVFSFFILLLYLWLGYLSLSNKILGKNMNEFAKTRNTVNKTLTASRGIVYSVNGDELARNVSSYTVIAYLNKSKGNKIIKDIDKTSKELAKVLETDENKIKEILTKGKKDKKYQVELGKAGKGISELKKEEIEKLELPGIDFIESKKRFYPNGNFASYVVGYAKDSEVKVYNEDTESEETKTEIKGELGIEAQYNDLLKGKDGYIEYQQDRYGYKINNTNEYNVKAKDGYNIYLTIDSNIQRFVEAAVEKATAEYKPEWMQINVMDAKTGAILSSGSTPSFDPNLRDITNYESPLVTYTYEPGSTMKTYTYMCAIDENVYKGNDTFKSGSIKIGDDKVNDWNKYGWGEITFDKGYEYSSNVGIANLMTKYLSADKLKSCLKKYGFGKKTGVEIAREQKGELPFKYSIEVVNAGFGQGITTTAVQQLQAASIIANDGKMVKPYIIDKIIDPSNNSKYYTSNKKISDQIVEKTTIDKMKDLMYNAIHGTDQGTAAKAYNIEGIDLIGKTGTAQIYSKSGYSGGYNNYIYSFLGMYPKDKPEIIIYAAMKKPKKGTNNALINATKDVIMSVAKYKNFYDDSKVQTSKKSFEMSSYTNKNTKEVTKLLKNNGLNPIVIGYGDKIIKQYPTFRTKVLKNGNVILFTNSSDKKMPSLEGWSRKEVITLCQMLNIKYEISGSGYVVDQSIKKDTKIDKNSKLVVNLKSKYEKEEKNE